MDRGHVIFVNDVLRVMEIALLVDNDMRFYFQKIRDSAWLHLPMWAVVEMQREKDNANPAACEVATMGPPELTDWSFDANTSNPD